MKAPGVSADSVPSPEAPLDQQPAQEVPANPSPSLEATMNQQPVAEAPSPDCSAIEDKVGASISPLNDLLVKRDLFGRFKDGVRFSLVDDQIDLGYHDLLACLLFGDKGVPVSTPVGTATTDGKCVPRSMKSPDVLVDWLFRSSGGTRLSGRCVRMSLVLLGNASTRSKLRMLLNRQSTQRMPISTSCCLIFDYSGSTMVQPGRTELPSTFVGFLPSGRFCCAHATEESEPVGPALANLQRVAAAAQKRLDNLLAPKDRRTSQVGPEYLLFLPLLLCYVDPSLPIVLFSSTRQRIVSQLFVEYANVITPFGKPFVAPYEDAPTPKSYIDELSSAIKAALLFHEARVVWVELAKRTKWLAGCPGASARYSFRELPSKSTKKPPLAYTVQMSDIEHLGREYREIMLRGRFADALMVPGNWLEGLDAEIGKFDAPSDELYNAIAKDCFDSFAKRSQAALIAWIQELCTDKAQGPVRSVLEVLKAPFGDKSPERKAINHFSNWLADPPPKDFVFSPEKVVGLDLNGMIPQNPAAVLATYLTSPKVTSALAGLTRPNWTKVVRADARYAEFAPLRGLRNIRAHYSVRPEDSGEVREVAIWCWLWLLAASASTRAASVLFEVGSGPFDELGIHIQPGKYPLAKTSQVDFKGYEACRGMLRQFCDFLSRGWLKLGDDRLKKALELLVTGPRTTVVSSALVTSTAPESTPPTAAPAMNSSAASFNSTAILLKTRSQSKKLAEPLKMVITPQPRTVSYVNDCNGSYQVDFTNTDDAGRFVDALRNSHWLFVLGAYFQLDEKATAEAGPRQVQTARQKSR